MTGETMYALATLHNRIFWNLAMQGKITGWPEVRQSFNIAVVPGPPGHGPAAS
jgi:hypothetical protein